MESTLIICEKPDAAARLAEALSEGEVRKLSKHGIPYFEINGGGRRLLVCSAVGHLYEVDVKGGRGRREYPVWDFTWKPKHLVERGMERQERFIKAISELAKEADSFINACDYDIEGSLIGYMVLKYACGGADAKAKRMKFSTLTKRELKEAYERLMPSLDYPLVHAGMCRHEVDWLYGINLSRALTESARRFSGKYATLSTGRVQGPTLKFVVEREKAIRTFVPTPYWTIKAIVDVDGEKLEASYEIPRVDKKSVADGIVEECGGKEGRIAEIKSKDYKLAPPTPFDLTRLQLEAYRHFGFTPKQTLDIAERLYLDALISYPRTSSQKLPPTIGYKEIFEGLKEAPEYEKLVKELLSAGELRPNEGGRSDPAHPAIYPTGVQPKAPLRPREKKVYDLVVKRFMATFSTPGLKRSERASIEVEGRVFHLRGSRILEPGWLKFYAPYSSLEETLLPPLSVGQKVVFEEVKAELKYTQPPPRFNPTSLVKLMEEQGIGTKATRADIVDTLYKRGYVKNERMVATDLAFEVVRLMAKYCPKVVSVEFTRELEGMMEKIEAGEETRENVVLRATEHLKPIMAELKLKEGKVGGELTKAIKLARSSEITLKIPCPKCGSQLLIIRSKRTGKRFIGCSGLWKGGCKFSLPLPQKGKLTLLDKECPECGFQMVQVRISGRRPMVSCPNCYVNKLTEANKAKIY